MSDKTLPSLVFSEKTAKPEMGDVRESGHLLEWSSLHPLIKDDVIAYASEMGFNGVTDTYLKYESLMLVMLQWEDWQHRQLQPEIIEALGRWNKYIQIKGNI